VSRSPRVAFGVDRIPSFIVRVDRSTASTTVRSIHLARAKGTPGSRDLSGDPSSIAAATSSPCPQPPQEGTGGMCRRCDDPRRRRSREIYTAETVIEAPLLAADPLFPANLPAARARTGGDPRQIGSVRNPIGGRPRRECADVPLPAARRCRPRVVHRFDRHGRRRPGRDTTVPLVQLFRIRDGTMPNSATTSHQYEWTEARVASGRTGSATHRRGLWRFARASVPGAERRPVQKVGERAGFAAHVAIDLNAGPGLNR